MNLKKEIALRLKEVRITLGYTQIDFSKELSITQGLYSKYERGVIELRDKIKERLSQMGISLDWLLTGKDNMFINMVILENQSFLEHKREMDEIKLKRNLKTKRNPRVKYKKNTINGLNTLNLNKTAFSLDKVPFSLDSEFNDKDYLSEEPQIDIIKVPILDIKASAGYGIEGIDNPNIIDYLNISKHLLGRYSPNKVICLEIQGDSMEPDFRSGDYVLCAVGVIEANGFYVINIGGNILFKRLQFIKREKILIKSINPAYDTEEIFSDEKIYFGIIGKVFRHIRRL